MQEFYDRVILGDMDDDGLATDGNACVDIRDLAKAHVLAAQKAEAGGERIIISSGEFLLSLSTNESLMPLNSFQRLTIGKNLVRRSRRLIFLELALTPNLIQSISPTLLLPL